MGIETNIKSYTRFGICFIINEKEVWLEPKKAIKVGDIDNKLELFLEMDEYGYFNLYSGFKKDFNKYANLFI